MTMRLPFFACSACLVIQMGACSSSSDEVSGKMDDDRISGLDAPRGGSGTFAPSHLPPNACDTPGVADLSVPAGTSLGLDPSAPCDAVISQGPDLPTICVRKFANVSIAGNLSIDIHTATRGAIAIVATGTFDLTGTITSLGEGDVRGAGESRGSGAGLYEPGGGAGHLTAGGRGGNGGAGGPSYPTSGSELAMGAVGGTNGAASGSGGTSARGRAGGALQLVACGDLNLSGQVSVSGGRGGNGAYYGRVSAGGGGGGSGGTLLIEARRVLSNGAANLTAVGGAGGDGAESWYHMSKPPLPGGAGGSGGTGSRPPSDGISGSFAPPYIAASGGGGGGGAAGRIAIRVPAGTSLPAIASDPPAEIGVVSLR